MSDSSGRPLAEEACMEKVLLADSRNVSRSTVSHRLRQLRRIPDGCRSVRTPVPMAFTRALRNSSSVVAVSGERRGCGTRPWVPMLSWRIPNGGSLSMSTSAMIQLVDGSVPANSMPAVLRTTLPPSQPRARHLRSPRYEPSSPYLELHRAALTSRVPGLR